MIEFRDPLCFPQLAGCNIKAFAADGGFQVQFVSRNYNSATGGGNTGEYTPIGYQLYFDAEGIPHKTSVTGEVPSSIYVEDWQDTTLHSRIIIVVYDDEGNEVRRFDLFDPLR